MSWGVLVWIVAIVLWIVSSYNKAKQKRARARKHAQEAERAASPHLDMRETLLGQARAQGTFLDEFLGRTSLAEFVRRNELEELFSNVENPVPVQEREVAHSEPSPEEEGSFRTFYEEAAGEGIAATVVTETPSSEKPMEAATVKPQPFRFAGGDPFDLRMAMLYDVVLHRRTTGFFARRPVNRTLSAFRTYTE